MTNYCPFSKNHKCLKWTDYQLTRFELEEAEETCHGNWIEIEKKNPTSTGQSRPVRAFIRTSRNRDS